MVFNREAVTMTVLVLAHNQILENFAKLPMHFSRITDKHDVQCIP